MFDFEKLHCYKRSKELKSEILKLVKESKHIDPFLRDQLKRASISTVINIAEGSGKFSKADKRNFYTISRGSVYECVSLLEIISEENGINKDKFDDLYRKYEELSKMLVGLINSQK
jgi:four helix bundle protein